MRHRLSLERWLSAKRSSSNISWIWIGASLLILVLISVGSQMLTEILIFGIISAALLWICGKALPHLNSKAYTNTATNNVATSDARCENSDDRTLNSVVLTPSNRLANDEDGFFTPLPQEPPMTPKPASRLSSVRIRAGKKVQ